MTNTAAENSGNNCYAVEHMAYIHVN